MIRPPGNAWARLALLAGILHFLLTTGLGLGRHWGYLTSMNDLGVFDQAIWGIANGAPFLNTSNLFGQPINWLGYHFNPILLALAPFYLIHPAAEWLIIIQAAALSITAWPLYLLARRVLDSELAAFLWAGIFLASPFVLHAAIWDFHPVALAAPFMALGVLAIELRKPWLFGLACLFLLLVQEQFGIAVAGFGILWWLRNRSTSPAMAAFCMGIAHAVLVLGLIMPALSPTGGHVMTSGELGQLSRYAWLGGSAGEIVRNAITYPFAIVRTVLLEGGGAGYLALLLVPLLATPLAGIEFLLPGLADLGANLLSANAMPRSLFSYHSVSLMPVLVAAGIHGASRIASRWRRYSAAELAKLVLWATLLLSYFTAPLPLPFAYDYWKPVERPFKPEPALAEIHRLIPPAASVSAQANVGAHFSQRYRIEPFRMKTAEADFIVLRLASPTRWTADQFPAIFGSLAHHLGMPPAQYLDTLEQLLADKAYGIVYWNSPWLVLSKGHEGSQADREGVNARLAQLRKAWWPGAGRGITNGRESPRNAGG